MVMLSSCCAFFLLRIIMPCCHFSCSVFFPFYCLCIYLALSFLPRPCRDDRGSARREMTLFAHSGDTTAAMHNDMSAPHHQADIYMISMTNNWLQLRALPCAVCVFDSRPCRVLTGTRTARRGARTLFSPIMTPPPASKSSDQRGTTRDDAFRPPSPLPPPPISLRRKPGPESPRTVHP